MSPEVASTTFLGISSCSLEQMEAASEPGRTQETWPPLPPLPCALTSLQGARNSPSGGTGPALSGTEGLQWAAPGNPRCVGHPAEKNWILSSVLGSPGASRFPPSSTVPYLHQLDSQGHLEAQCPHFHGQHVVVTCRAPGTMGYASCRDSAVSTGAGRC